ncbi:MAG TPA: DUF2167 domain-containing protein [Verrucomicrobiae bacterium]|nr:DUF2167 domain-containing protein [Verrucomicrobiae bacterium]
MESQQEHGWISGPARVKVGTVGDIDVPLGYRFIDAQGAHGLLTRMNNPAPSGLAGILAPASGQWMAVLEYKKIGYVTRGSHDTLDAKAILQAVRQRTDVQNQSLVRAGMQPFVSVDWTLAPVYDPWQHSVEWAVNAQTCSTSVINHTVLLLARHGVLDVTVVQPAQSALDIVPLSQLASCISFKVGERYTDHQDGDAVAAANLQELVIGNEKDLISPPMLSPTLIFSASAGGLAVTVGLLFHRRRKIRKPLARIPLHDLHTAPVAEDTRHCEPAATTRSSHDHKVRRRRKVFDYHRFYSDAILQLSSSTYSGSGITYQQTSPAAADSAANASWPAGLVETREIVKANLDLIAAQKSLIEEQKCILREQSRLIGEKKKMIDDQAELFDSQSDLAEKSVFM